MTVNKRKKATRYRASKTHGCGSMKKRRGAGHRGGRGNASSGKRSDARKPSFWKETKYFGRHGFKNQTPNKDEHNVINLSTVQDKLPTWVQQKHAQDKGGKLAVDLSKLGIQKLLAQGKVTAALDITVERASAKAIEKVQAQGGSVTVLG